MSIYEKNLAALSSQNYDLLREELGKIKPNRFKYLLDKDILATNILDENGESLYVNPLEELNEKLDEYNKNYFRYPYMYYFGIGNAILYQAILKNELIKRVVVYESELELIFLALNLYDFARYLATGKLVIIYNKLYTQGLSNLVLTPDMISYARTYELQTNCKYYLKYYAKDIEKINNQNLKNLKERSLYEGNMPVDSMQGVYQFCYNLPKLISHPSMKTLVAKRGKKAKTALICATGPSLNKQLDLLKKYQEHLVIFCVDASFDILINAGIKPDYVISFERVKESAAFFKNYHAKKEKDILFIATSISHKNTIQMLEKYKRNYILALRSVSFDANMDFLAPFAGFIPGASVAHMAAGMAISLGFETLLFIGQDLAYAKDGSTHGKGHIYEGLFDPSDRLEVTAYGGKGKVLTNFFWDSFKTNFTHIAATHRDTKFINCTQGGARIEDFEELSFKEAIDLYAPLKIKKNFPKPHAFSRKTQNELLEKSYAYLIKSRKKTATLLKACKKISKRIDLFVKGSLKYNVAELTKELDDFKAMLDHKSFLGAIAPLIPSIKQNERMLTPLYTKMLANDQEKQNISIAWLYAHDAVLKDYTQQLSVQVLLLKDSVIPLRDLCEKRGFKNLSSFRLKNKRNNKAK